MTSGIADTVLGLFIPLAIGIFFAVRPLTAALLVVLGAEMFLPVGSSFKIPFFPELTKVNLPYICTLIGCLLACARKLRKAPKQRAILVIAILATVASALTGLTNGDVLTFGDAGQTVRPGMTLKDGFYVGATTFFPILLAFYLGYVLVRNADDIDRVLTGFSVAGLIYCLFAIVEMRMSPQMHNWVYGYDTGAFGETYRWGGYRPKVFMVHGLTLARFFLATFLALFVLAKRRRVLLGLPVRFLAWFHFLVFVLCRSTGAIVLGFIGYVLISFVKPRRQLVFAAVVSVATLSYPLLRASNLFPEQSVLSAAEWLGKDRSGSLKFRFDNEDLLLAHARERLLFGWGTYGRNRVYDAHGEDISTTDGYWVIVLGITGLIGYLIAFGVLLWPCVLARRRLAKRGTEVDKTQLAGLAIIVALTGVDLIPNGLWAVPPYFLAGVLMRGLVELQTVPRDGSQP